MSNPTETTAPTPPKDNSDQRLWPVATVMASGIFATTLVQVQGLGFLPLNHILTVDMKLDSNQSASFIALATMPWSLKAIAGLMVDGVPLFGSRRRAYLLLSSLMAITLWALMGMNSHNYGRLLWLTVGMNAAIVFGSTASGGLLVEAGQKHGASGRLSSLRVFAQNLGAALGLPMGGLLAGYALGWTSLAAVIPLLCMFVSAWFLLKDNRLAVSPGSPVAVAKFMAGQLANVCRWQMLVPVLLVFFIQAVPTFRSTCFYQYQTITLHYTDAQLGWLGLVGYGVALVSSGVYAWCCRWMPLRVSLYLAILLTALSALPYLYYQAYEPGMHRACLIEGVGTFLQYMAYLPIFDLIVRSTPKGSEALGYSVLISVWNIGLMISTKTGPMLYETVLHKNMNQLIWLNAGITLAGVVLVFLLPAMLVKGREGKHTAAEEVVMPRTQVLE